MGFIKKTIKEAWRVKAEQRKEKQAYKQILGKKTRAIKREAYAKEAVIQARASAKADAKADYAKQRVKRTLPKADGKKAMGFLNNAVDNFYNSTDKKRRK